MTYRILSLSGGGIRGIFQAVYLRSIAAELETPLRANFDLIAGTSTGAIIALGIASGLDINRIVDLFLKYGKDIFESTPRPRLRQLLGEHGIVNYCIQRGPRYSNYSLETLLRDLFKNQKLKDCRLPPVIITASKLDAFGHKVFTTLDEESLKQDGDLMLYDIAMASCAAPIYFPSVRPAGQERTFVDGGLWANTPSLLAVLEAHYRAKARIEDIRVISIGNGTVPKGIAASEYNALSILKYVPMLLEVMFSAQHTASNELVERLLGTDNFYDINVDITPAIELDEVRTASDRLPGLAEDVAAKTRRRVGEFLMVPKHTGGKEELQIASTTMELGLTSSSLNNIASLCRLRDKRFSTTFYGQPYFEVIKPLLDSILPDGGIPCFVGEGKNPLPESTASCLLALHRCGLLDNMAISLIREYLFSENAEVRRLNLLERKEDLLSDNVDIGNCAWSYKDGKSVWSTSQVLWALLATGYEVSYRPIIVGAINWLLSQQYPNGGWSLVRCVENVPNVFVTSMTMYVLQLSVKNVEWPDVKKRKISHAISKGCDYLKRSRAPGQSYWSYNPQNASDDSIEPTSTAMALWGLRHCCTREDGLEAIIKDGLESLRNDLSEKFVWDNKVIVDGIISEKEQKKTLSGFTLSIPIILLQLGSHPSDPMILKPVHLLRDIRTSNGWEFYSTTAQPRSADGYHDPKTHYVGSGSPMTFTTALALWAIEEWHRRTLQCQLLKVTER
jgi:uncharacterized protein